MVRHVLPYQPHVARQTLPLLNQPHVTHNKGSCFISWRTAATTAASRSSFPLNPMADSSRSKSSNSGADKHTERPVQSRSKKLPPTQTTSLCRRSTLSLPFDHTHGSNRNLPSPLPPLPLAKMQSSICRAPSCLPLSDLAETPEWPIKNITNYSRNVRVASGCTSDTPHGPTRRYSS